MRAKNSAAWLLCLAACCCCLVTVSSALKAQQDTSALLAIQQDANVALANQQQQQQQQQGSSSNVVPATLNGGQTTTASTTATQPAKSNHRLVNKLKDARHRRRNRHNRHRLNKQQLVNSAIAGVSASNANEPKPALASDLHHQVQGSPTLIALESIVEEVARAGQQLPAPQSVLANASGNNNNNNNVVSHQQTSAAASVGEILLDGSSSPMTHLQQAPGNREQINPPQQQQQQAQQASAAINQQLMPQQAQPPPAPPQQAQQPPLQQVTSLVTRGTTHNSRGFFLTSMLSKIMNVLNVTEFALEMRDGISSRASCMACNAVVGLFLSPLYSKEVFSAAIRTVCTSFKIQTPRVCSGLAEAFQDDFEYIRKNTKLTRDEVCGVVFGVDCARRPTYNLFWTVPIPDLPAKSQLQQQHQQEPANGNVNQLGSIPLGEHSTINMEDAPDMFEYRKSNGASSLKDPKQQQQQPSTLGPEVSSPPQTSQTLALDGGALQKVKAAKMLKRPQYIFDDEHQHLHQLEHQSSEQQNKQPVGNISDGRDGGNRDGRRVPLRHNKNKISSFVQITDIHIDPYYETGSLNDCGEPLCCRATSGSVALNDRRRRAGQWGDYGNCDVPIRTLRNALERIREQHQDAEYWLWTGDISPHDIWNISKTETTNHVRLVSKMVREYSNGVPVFPVIGNHEAHPVNSFAPPEIKGKFSMSWLYDVMAEEWSEWLPADAIRTLRIGGFYKLQVRKGFRIIALNTNYCARLNPWSFFDPVDPANMLKWLADELLEAELNQDKVHIIGHVPPDNRECTQAWLFNFINIIDRFKDTILAQFYGHTHRDEWRLIYSMQPNRQDEPIGVQYIGPSITPFTENNPAYRIYHQDKIGNIVDSETYYFNLTEANATPNSVPEWRFSYSASAHLNMTNGLTPIEWNHFLHKMHDDDDLFDAFYGNFYRFSEPKSNQACRAKCKYSMLSDLRLSHPYKTKPKPFFPNRKISNHHGRDRHERDHHHHHHHHHHHKRLRHTD